MAAPTTFQDLPDDMLHEIFERVLADEPERPQKKSEERPPQLYADLPPQGAHLALRCVCRRWRDIADWERLSKSTIMVDTLKLADAGAVRARHPAAFKSLSLGCVVDGHSTSVSRAASSLINGSADLRRALSALLLSTCCLPALVPAVTPIASCTALVKLALSWKIHEKERAVPSNVLAPLSALRMLGVLQYSHSLVGKALPESAVLAPLPVLPDAPRLTCFILDTPGNFVPVGSDAALGRLRRLEFHHHAPVRELVDAEDPFLLRAAFDAGTWQPSRLTGLQNLVFELGPVSDDLRAPLRPSPTGSRPGSEWALLAAQVTQLYVGVRSTGYRRPSTGIVAGLGVLTALRDLRVAANFAGLAELTDPGSLELASIDRVRAPHLTHLAFHCASTPVNVARFPNLVLLSLASVTHRPSLNLRSLVARSSLKTLILANLVLSAPGLINLAELFAGGGGWPVLEDLTLDKIVLEWDETGLAGAPSAAEFAERARQLLPALADVEIDEPRGRNALRDRSRVMFVVACRRHVVPALLGLNVRRK